MDHGTGVDGALADGFGPAELRGRAAGGAQRARRMLCPVAGGAVLQQQPVVAGRVTPRLGHVVGRRDVVKRAHRSTPSSTVAWVDRIPPVPWASATSAFGTCRSPHSPRS